MDSPNTQPLQQPIIRPRREQLGRLRCYNQFPRYYHNITEMTEDLPRIKALGFTSVWSNPMFESCKSTEWSQQEILRGATASGQPVEEKNTRLHSKPGSPYAIRSFNIDERISNHRGETPNDDERREKDYADIRAYTDAARKLKITPMSDFVIRHVAVDNPLTKEKPHWFKRHPNGNYAFFGRDEHYRVTGQSWDDVLEFNYDDPKIRSEIVNEYLKPMADILIGKLGFDGLRIDAAGKIPREVYSEILPHVDALCMKRTKKPAVILGETLGQNVNEFTHTGGFMDHVYNSVYFQPFTREFWQSDNTWFSDTKGHLQAQVGPTVGFSGNHDVVRLADYYHNKQHIRGDLLRQVVLAGCLDGDISIQKIVNVFISLNDKGAFSKEQLTQLVDLAAENKLIDASHAAKQKTDIVTTGKLLQQDVRQWFTEHPPVTDKAGQAVFKRIVDDTFSIVAQEKKKEIAEMRNPDMPRTKKLVRESDLIKLIPGKLDEIRLNRLMKEAFCFTAFASDGGWFLFQGDELGASKRTSVFEAGPEDLKTLPYPDMDYSKFVCSVNAVLSKLPPPAHPEWVQRCYLKNGADKAFSSFLIHQGEGFSNPSHLVIANVSESKQRLDVNTFMEINEANGRNDTPEKCKFPARIYLCGDIELTPHLRTALKQKHVAVFDASNASAKSTNTDRARTR